jgi:hypothetical protein
VHHQSGRLRADYRNRISANAMTPTPIKISSLRLNAISELLSVEYINLLLKICDKGQKGAIFGDLNPVERASASRLARPPAC